MITVMTVQKGKLFVLRVLNPGVFSQTSAKRKLKSEKEVSLAIARVVAGKLLALATL